MKATDIHRQEMAWAYELLEMVMEGLSADQAHTTPAGIANPISATYAHALVALDAIPTLLLQGNLPLYETSWKDKTGISEPQWQSDQDWARRVEVDLQAARAYGKAAFENADAYIAALSEGDLAREVDLTSSNLGVQTVSWCISALITSHLNIMAGEVSALKGTQGLQGYPF